MFKNAAAAANERQIKKTQNRGNSPSRSPGKKGPVGHDDIEFEIIDPQPTEDDQQRHVNQPARNVDATPSEDDEEESGSAREEVFEVV